MITLDEIKIAAAALPLEERLELSDWIEGCQDVRDRRVEELRAKLDVGLEQARRGDLMSSADVFSRLRNRIAEVAGD